MPADRVAMLARAARVAELSLGLYVAQLIVQLAIQRDRQGARDRTVIGELVWHRRFDALDRLRKLLAD